MDLKNKQLLLEIDLLLLHLAIPTDEKKQQAILSQETALNVLRAEVGKIDPELARSTLNHLIQTMGLGFEVRFLSPENAKEYVKNNPSVTYLVTRIYYFLAVPLRKEINPEHIIQQKDKMLKLVGKKTMTVEEALYLMDICKSTIEEIRDIVDNCEVRSGRPPHRQTLKKVAK